MKSSPGAKLIDVMYRLRKIVLFSLSIMALESLQVQPAQSLSEGAGWRSLSREADILLDENAFSAAAANYKQAIDILEKSATQTDSVYNIYLNLAETYRRAGELAKARLLLDRIEPIVISKQWDDPLLPARYWRRRADLCLSEHNTTGYINAQTKALAISDKLTPEGFRSPYYKQKMTYLYKLSDLQQWGLLLSQVSDMEHVSDASKSDKIRIDQCIQKGCLVLRTVTNHQIELHNLSGALSILLPLTRLECNPDALSNTWRSWVVLCLDSHMADRADKAIECLEWIAADNQKPRPFAAQTPHARLCANFCLASLYAQRGDQAQMKQCWDRICDLCANELLGSQQAAADSEFPLFSPAYEAIAAEEINALRIKHDLNRIKSLQRVLLRACQLTDMKHCPRSAPEASHFCYDHVLFRLNLAELDAMSGNPTQAEETLATVSPQAIKFFPAWEVRLLGRRLHNARGFFRSGQIEQASKLLDDAKIQYTKITDSIKNKTANKPTIDAFRDSSIANRIAVQEEELKSARAVKH